MKASNLFLPVFAVIAIANRSFASVVNCETTFENGQSTTTCNREEIEAMMSNPNVYESVKGYVAKTTEQMYAEYAAQIKAEQEAQRAKRRRGPQNLDNVMSNLEKIAQAYKNAQQETEKVKNKPGMSA